MGSLHVVDSRSQTQGTSHCYLYKVLEYNWFSLVECWITSELDFEGANTPMDPPSSDSKLIFHGDIVYEG